MKHRSLQQKLRDLYELWTLVAPSIPTPQAATALAWLAEDAAGTYRIISKLSWRFSNHEPTATEASDYVESTLTAYRVRREGGVR